MVKNYFSKDGKLYQYPVRRNLRASQKISLKKKQPHGEDLTLKLTSRTVLPDKKGDGLSLTVDTENESLTVQAGEQYAATLDKSCTT